MQAEVGWRRENIPHRVSSTALLPASDVCIKRLHLSQISSFQKRSCSPSISLGDSGLIHTTDILVCQLGANHSINTYARSVLRTQINNTISDFKKFISERGDGKISSLY